MDRARSHERGATDTARGRLTAPHGRAPPHRAPCRCSSASPGRLSTGRREVFRLSAPITLRRSGRSGRFAAAALPAVWPRRDSNRSRAVLVRSSGCRPGHGPGRGRLLDRRRRRQDRRWPEEGTCWDASTPCASSTVPHPNGSFSSCSGGTDTDHLIVGSRQQPGNYVSVRRHEPTRHTDKISPVPKPAGPYARRRRRDRPHRRRRRRRHVPVPSTPPSTYSLTAGAASGPSPGNSAWASTHHPAPGRTGRTAAYRRL